MPRKIIVTKIVMFYVILELLNFCGFTTISTFILLIIHKLRSSFLRKWLCMIEKCKRWVLTLIITKLVDITNKIYNEIHHLYMKDVPHNTLELPNVFQISMLTHMIRNSQFQQDYTRIFSEENLYIYIYTQNLSKKI